MSKAIPLLIAVEALVPHDDGSRGFWLRVGVVGVNAPLIAKIEIPFSAPVKVLDVETSGGIFLPTDIENAFILKCFKVVYPSLEYSDIGDLPLPDATGWIRATFEPAEAESIVVELRKQVKNLDFHPMQSSAFIPVGT